jgi:hypothetical protein
MIRLCGQQHSVVITAAQLYQQSVLVGYYSHMAAAFRFCRWKSPNQLMDLIEHYGSSWMDGGPTTNGQDGGTLDEKMSSAATSTTIWSCNSTTTDE